MFKLTVSKTVVVPMKGALKAEDGKDQPFDFELLCDRMSEPELAAMRDAAPEDSKTQREVMETRVTGWRKVLDKDGQPADFTPEGLASLFDINGMASLSFFGCIEASSAVAKEKNGSKR